jgi:hypothetical protein
VAKVTFRRTRSPIDNCRGLTFELYCHAIFSWYLFILASAVSLTSLIKSRLRRSCSSFYCSSYVEVRNVVSPISTGTTASLPNVIRNGVSPVGILTVVL